MIEFFFFNFIFHGIDLKYVNGMCFKLYCLYSQATCQIKKLKGKNESVHSRAKYKFLQKIFLLNF